MSHHFMFIFSLNKENMSVISMAQFAIFRIKKFVVYNLNTVGIVFLYLCFSFLLFHCFKSLTVYVLLLRPFSRCQAIKLFVNCKNELSINLIN